MRTAAGGRLLVHKVKSGIMCLTNKYIIAVNLENI
jgi:hypothetical protein